MARRRLPAALSVRADVRGELLGRYLERAERQAVFPDGSIVLDTRAAARARALKAGKPVVFAGWEVRAYLPASLVGAAWVRLERSDTFSEMRMVRDRAGTIAWETA